LQGFFYIKQYVYHDKLFVAFFLLTVFIAYLKSLRIREPARCFFC